MSTQISWTSLAEAQTDAWRIVQQAVVDHFGPIDGRHHELTATLCLFSGGNDSTLLLHWCREWVTAAVHCNTGIGVEETRTFARDSATAFDVPLVEKHPKPGDTYRDLVIDQGFPGPAMHFKMYQRLKERQLDAVRRDYVRNPRQQRVMFLAGRRRAESARRSNIPESERRGSTVWVSPLANWTDDHMAEYRELHPDIPRNEVSDHLHMSGECLCGAFAKPGELDEIRMFYPHTAAIIDDLEREVAAAGHERCRWGWGAYRREPPSESGPMCDSCDWRQLQLTISPQPPAVA